MKEVTLVFFNKRYKLRTYWVDDALFYCGVNIWKYFHSGKLSTLYIINIYYLLLHCFSFNVAYIVFILSSCINGIIQHLFKDPQFCDDFFFVSSNLKIIIYQFCLLACTNWFVAYKLRSDASVPQKRRVQSWRFLLQLDLGSQ